MTDLSVSVANLVVSYGSHRVLDTLSIDIPKGEFLVLLGSSGCGKSTLLNAIAGLQDTADGVITISGRDVTHVDPKERGIGMVFQSYALYPRMTVRQNMSFGLKIRKLPKADIEMRVQRTAKMLHIDHLLDRKPSDLSGGQRQRVAIGRALVRDVDVFLFDEPLSNLDAQLRSKLRVELKKLHQTLGNTMIYVTHDQVEAMTLADRIAVMKNGRIQQLANPAEIYNRPANLFVAGFIGSPKMNFLRGVMEAGRFIVAGQGLAAAGAAIPAGEAILGIRPEHVTLATQDGAGVLRATVELSEELGPETIVWARLADDSQISLRVAPEDMPATGSQVLLTLNLERANFFDPDSGMRIGAA